MMSRIGHFFGENRPVVVGALLLFLAVVLAPAGCGEGGQEAEEGSSGSPVVLTDTSFLADIVRNVAGDRFAVSSIVPEGVDPHSFEPTPRDAAMIAGADAVVINSPGLEPTVDDLIAGAGMGPIVIDASAGIPGREADPHLWLDPLSVLVYVDNIEKGLAALDPDGAAGLKARAEAYRRELSRLDAWIEEEVSAVPPERRLLVTNHESLGRFAARYGFTVVGAVLPGHGTEGAPSAEGLASLVKRIKATGAPAIFLETGNQPDLAGQVARETGAKVVTDLHTHSLGEHARDYLEMMRWNVQMIVEALR